MQVKQEGSAKKEQRKWNKNIFKEITQKKFEESLYISEMQY